MKSESEIRERLEEMSKRVCDEIEPHRSWCEGQRDACLWVLDESNGDGDE